MEPWHTQPLCGSLWVILKLHISWKMKKMKIELSHLTHLQQNRTPCGKAIHWNRSTMKNRNHEKLSIAIISYSQLKQHVSRLAAYESPINDDRRCSSGRQHAWRMSSSTSKALNESRQRRPCRLRRLISLVLPHDSFGTKGWTFWVHDDFGTYEINFGTCVFCSTTSVHAK